MKKIILTICILMMLFSISGCGCFKNVKPEGFAERRQIGPNQETDSVIGAGLVFRF